MKKKKPKAPKPPIASTRSSILKVSTNTSVSPSKSIRISRAFLLPQYVRQALQKLDEAGHVAYVVGGSVRDFLLERESKDHDLVTSANPDELVKIFPDSVTVGKAFGVIKVPTRTDPPLLEIATFREDMEYEDHRHPTGVVFSGPSEDAHRRDFTMNALLFDPKTSKVLDYVGGIPDLKARIIRAIGDPNVRFREDALRLLRAIRFKTALGFELDPQTAEAIRNRSNLITRVSPERIRDELNLMWQGPRPAEALRLLSEYGLLAKILPEVEDLKNLVLGAPSQRTETIWAHLLKTLECLASQTPVRSVALSWVAILHEVGRPVAFKANQGKNFQGHEIEAARIAGDVANRLRMPRIECDRISAMVADHMKFKGVFKMREATLERFVRQEYFPELLAFHKADATAWDGNLAFYEFCSSRLLAFQKSPLGHERLIDGKDLIQLGFKPGPEFSEILRVVEDLALEKKLFSKEEALEYVVKNFVR